MELFHSLAANFLRWPVLVRALISGLLVFLVLWPLLVSLIRLLLYYAIKFAGFLAVSLYLLLTNAVLAGLQKAFRGNAPVSRSLVSISNAATTITQKTDSRLKILSAKLKKSKKKYMKLSFLLYVIFYFLVALPNLFGKLVNPMYLETISVPQNAYLRAELLLFGDAYETVPLFASSSAPDIGMGKHTVLFDSTGGSLVNQQEAENNALLKEPTEPARDGYVFCGWYQNPMCSGTPWDFSADTVTGDITLYAGWVSTIPASVTAVSSSYNSITVSWSAVPNVSGYEVTYAGSSNGKYVSAGTATAAKFVHAGLVTGQTYYYKVKSYTILGSAKQYSGESAVASAKPVPLAPTSLAAVPSGASSIKLTYNAVPGASKYEIWRSDSSSDKYSLLNVTSALSFLNTKLKKGTTYYYKVRAYCIKGSEKEYSEFTPIISMAPA